MVRWSSGSRASACHRTARSSVPRMASVSLTVSGSSSVGYSLSSAAPPGADVQVGHGAAEVAADGRLVADPVPGAVRGEEGALEQVLGLVPVAGQVVGGRVQGGAALADVGGERRFGVVPLRLLGPVPRLPVRVPVPGSPWPPARLECVEHGDAGLALRVHGVLTPGAASAPRPLTAPDFSLDRSATSCRRVTTAPGCLLCGAFIACPPRRGAWVFPSAQKPAEATSWRCPPTVTALSQGPSGCG